METRAQSVFKRVAGDTGNAFWIRSDGLEAAVSLNISQYCHDIVQKLQLSVNLRLKRDFFRLMPAFTV